MLSALKILYSLGEPEDNIVAQAANRLGVGEFQIFQLAHADWFGTEVDARRLEPTFFRYLMYDQTDPWVRHFARRIIELDDRGALEIDSAHYHRYDAKSMRPLSRRKGLLTILAVAVFVIVFFSSAIMVLHGVIPESVGCLFPPCHWAG